MGNVSRYRGHTIEQIENKNTVEHTENISFHDETPKQATKKMEYPRKRKMYIPVNVLYFRGKTPQAIG